MSSQRGAPTRSRAGSSGASRSPRCLRSSVRTYLLDEPTNHLDPHHQMAVLGLFRALASAGSTVITTLHDPTLAARFADRVLLLFGDGRWTLGPVEERPHGGGTQ